MNKQHYLVMRTTHEVNKPLFVTTDKNKAIAYCNKADETFKRLRIRYTELYHATDTEEDVERNTMLLKQWCKMDRLDIDLLTPTTHYIEHIEIR